MFCVSTLHLFVPSSSIGVRSMLAVSFGGCSFAVCVAVDAGMLIGSASLVLSLVWAFVTCLAVDSTTLSVSELVFGHIFFCY